MGNNSDQFDYSAFTGTPKAPNPPEPVPHGAESSKNKSTTLNNSATTPAGWLSTGTAEEAAIAEISGPPLLWLVAANVCAVSAAIIVVLYGAHVAVAGVGWLLGGPVAIALLAIFTFRDTARQTDVFYSRVTWMPLAYGITMVLIFAAIITSALQLALWVGRL